MSDTVIQIEGLWKEYRLGVIGHGTLTRDLQSWWARVRGKEDPNSKIQPMLAGQEKQIEGDRFWALRDINLEVKEGEILGIIGRNGAGKSTLLKLLSRVTAPTKGQIKIKGRIASLLEVGTGFHPELTGRENIFMNGAILGMSKLEIKSKLDEIIDFSGVEKFIHTPVKRYSSGMYVRLAFAVAAHLEPEILVIDEVLAVGDVEFQKKCLGKMEEVSKGGRTVLFVSHNMAAIEGLCRRGLLICNGEAVMDDSSCHVVRKYLKRYDNEKNAVEWKSNKNQQDGDSHFKPVRFWLSDNIGTLLTMPVRNDQEIYVNIIFEIEITDPALLVASYFYDDKDNLIFLTVHTDGYDFLWKTFKKGLNSLRFKVPNRILNEGLYKIELVCCLHKRMWIIEPSKKNIDIFLHIQGGMSDSCYWRDKRNGFFAPCIAWE
ncbi:ABC transporter ATP-binding protein [Desulfobulbus sp. F3]|nr:ABC transporter ATP-binding protein [Desulfobulbus sp. F3]